MPDTGTVSTQTSAPQPTPRTSLAASSANSSQNGKFAEALANQNSFSPPPSPTESANPFKNTFGSNDSDISSILSSVRSGSPGGTGGPDGSSGSSGSSKVSQLAKIMQERSEENQIDRMVQSWEKTEAETKLAHDIDMQQRSVNSGRYATSMLDKYTTDLSADAFKRGNEAQQKLSGAVG